MITGFNTDIEHGGVVYHVQTEDKGLETPIILSLVYVGGAILASKRAPYEDLIAEGFSDEVLAERLKRQHRLICAAINSGRINDLKKMSSREDIISAPPAPTEVLVSSPVDAQPVEPAIEQQTNGLVVEEPIAEPVVEEPAVAPVPEEPFVEPVVAEPVEQPLGQDFVIVQEDDEIIREDEAVVEQEAEAPAAVSEFFDMELEDIPSQIWSPPEREEPPPEPEVVEAEETQPDFDDMYAAHDSRAYGLREVSLEEGLSILLLDEDEFYSGQTRIFRVLVANRKDGDEKPLGGVAVSIKILGTTFRPLIYSLKTDRDGVASVTTQIPLFTSGRAAVLVRAVAKDQAAELRCVIHPMP